MRSGRSFQRNLFELYFLALLGVLDGGPPTVPSCPLRVPIWFLRTPCEVPTAFCGGFFDLALTNFLTKECLKMQPYSCLSDLSDFIRIASRHGNLWEKQSCKKC
jgi:hypothetical protein